MSVYLDFKYLQCDILSNMISTYCLDAYASQLWDYEDKRIEKYDVWGPTEGACSMAVPVIITRPRTSALRMPSTQPAIRNANHM